MQLFKDILFFDAWADDDVIGPAVLLTLVKLVEFSEAILLWPTFAPAADDIVTESAVELILVVILVEFLEAKRPTRTCELEPSLKVLSERLREERLV